MIATVLAVLVLACFGFVACYLLHSRSGPFLPFSAWSIYLALDPVVAPASAAGIAAASTASTPAPASPSTSATASNQVAQTAPTPTVPTPLTIVYTSVPGANMPGSDMPVTGDDGKPASSQGTYGPAGCTAICSGNAGCAASVYSTSSRTCWIKTRLDPAGISADADKILQVPSNGSSGSLKNNYTFAGNDVASLALPSSDSCSALCQALPRSACQGTTYDTNAGICHVKAPAQNLTAQPMMVSWAKNYSPGS